MKLSVRILSFVFSICFLVSFSVNAMAEEINQVTGLEAAQELFNYGLFNGTGTDSNGNPVFDLQKTPTRNQAVMMLVRLLGKEDAAKSSNWDIPFTDVPDSVKPYVGYAYANGLTSGTSATTYNGDRATTVAQYITFVLRALGYKSGVDFEYSKAWEFSDKIGLTNGQYNANTTPFTREDVAIISYGALFCNLKGSDKSLLDTIGAKKYEFTKFDENYSALHYYKIKNKVYTDRPFLPELKLYRWNDEYYVQFNPTLYIEGTSDVRVEGPIVCLLALTNGLYEIVRNDNPYSDGEISIDLRSYRTLGMEISEDKTYYNIGSFDVKYTYQLQGKTLSTPTDAQESIQLISNVRFLRGGMGDWYVNINDFLSYFGFHSSVSVQKDSGLIYLVID